VVSRQEYLGSDAQIEEWIEASGVQSDGKQAVRVDELCSDVRVSDVNVGANEKEKLS
jgi:hypothetical protein